MKLTYEGRKALTERTAAAVQQAMLDPHNPRLMDTILSGRVGLTEMSDDALIAQADAYNLAPAPDEIDSADPAIDGYLTLQVECTGPAEPVWYFSDTEQHKQALEQALTTGLMVRAGWVEILPDDDCDSDASEFMYYLNMLLGESE